MDFQGIGTFLIGAVGVYNAIQVTLTKVQAGKAARHSAVAVTAVTALGVVVKELEVNTNSKMDELISAKEAAADLVGERRGTLSGIAQEQARQSKEPT
jgi:hypothetical protein